MNATEIYSVIVKETTNVLKAAHASGLIEVSDAEEAQALVAFFASRVAAESDDFIRAIGTEIWTKVNAA
jgi:hypothetical protein